VEPHNQALAARAAECQALAAGGLPTLPSTLAIEAQTNVFLRTREGLRLSPAGARLVERAERMAHEARGLASDAADAPTPDDVVEPTDPGQLGLDAGPPEDTSDAALEGGCACRTAPVPARPRWALLSG
jgi:aminoglycoside phosphotransferase (APT) family kinase protein